MLQKMLNYTLEHRIQKIVVITSYSIHYTKLYESAEPQERDPTGRGLLRGDGAGKRDRHRDGTLTGRRSAARSLVDRVSQLV